MKWFPLLIGLILGTHTAVASESWQAQEQAREQLAQQELTTMSQQLRTARSKLTAAQQLSKALAAQFAEQEKQLVELNGQWERASTDMNEVFAVTRQGAADALKLLSSSAVEGQYPERLQALTVLAQEKQVPDRAALALLPATLLQEIHESARVVEFNGKVLDAQGVATEQALTRIGSFALFSQQGFLQASPEGFSPILALPSSVQSALVAYQGREGDALPLDPSHGALLAMLAQTPSLWQRVQQGGAVGYIIMTLFIGGLVIALWRMVFLSIELSRVRRQITDRHYRDDNALGRVLAVTSKYPHLAMSDLELRLDEAILQESPRLERGISMVKVIAAIAPMLGLLGTVTGMIGTFQAITLFGSGDPKIMAGGISMALVTTVQGLVAAIPLILAHSLLQSRFTELSNILEQQVAGILAERAEADGAQEQAA